MDHNFSDNQTYDQSINNEGTYTEGKFHHAPKERFTTALKISGLIRLGIKACAECEQSWEEDNCIPLQDECGHVKCRSCFNHGSYHTNPCNQCFGISGRRKLGKKRKADGQCENEKLHGNTKSVRNSQCTYDYLEIVDVRDILSGKITNDDVRTTVGEPGKNLTYGGTGTTAGLIKNSSTGDTGLSTFTEEATKNFNTGEFGQSSNAGKILETLLIPKEPGKSLIKGAPMKNFNDAEAGQSSNARGIMKYSSAGDPRLISITGGPMTNFNAGESGRSSSGGRLLETILTAKKPGKSSITGGPMKNFNNGEAEWSSNAGGLIKYSSAGDPVLISITGGSIKNFNTGESRRNSNAGGLEQKSTVEEPGNSSIIRGAGIKANQEEKMTPQGIATKNTEHDKETATLFKKNEIPEPPIPTRDKEEKPFSCNKCPARFNSEHDLKLHEPLHLVYNGFLFTCEICDEGFWKKIHLARHLKKTHKFPRTSRVNCTSENKLDLTAYIKHILNKDKFAVTSGGPTEDNSSNDVPSTTLNTAADNLHDVEGPLVENQIKAQNSTEDDDLFILKINYVLPKKTETPESPNSKTRVTVSYEDDGTTSVLFHNNSKNEDLSI